MTAVPLWAWAATLAVLALLIVIDLVLTRKGESGLRTFSASQIRRHQYPRMRDATVNTQMMPAF